MGIKMSQKKFYSDSGVQVIDVSKRKQKLFYLLVLAILETNNCGGGVLRGIQ